MSELRQTPHTWRSWLRAIGLYLAIALPVGYGIWLGAMRWWVPNEVNVEVEGVGAYRLDERRVIATEYRIDQRFFAEHNGVQPGLRLVYRFHFAIVDLPIASADAEPTTLSIAAVRNALADAEMEYLSVQLDNPYIDRARDLEAPLAEAGAREPERVVAALLASVAFADERRGPFPPEQMVRSRSRFSAKGETLAVDLQDVHLGADRWSLEDTAWRVWVHKSAHHIVTVVLCLVVLGIPGLAFTAVRQQTRPDRL